MTCAGHRLLATVHFTASRKSFGYTKATACSQFETWILSVARCRPSATAAEQPLVHYQAAFSLIQLFWGHTQLLNLLLRRSRIRSPASYSGSRLAHFSDDDSAAWKYLGSLANTHSCLLSRNYTHCHSRHPCSYPQANRRFPLQSEPLSSRTDWCE